MNKVLDMAALAPETFRGLHRDRTLVVVPFGPIEYHGDHLPLGTDTLQADVFRSVGERFVEGHPDWTVLLVPVIPLGTDCVPHGGSLWVEPGVIRAVADQTARRLLEYGFRFVALWSGHAGLRQVTALEETARRLTGTRGKTKVTVFSPITHFLDRFTTDDFLRRINSHLDEPLSKKTFRQVVYEGHGGRFETSHILAIAPDLVGDRHKNASDHTPAPLPALRAMLGRLAGLANLLHGGSASDLTLGIEALSVATGWLSRGAPRGYMGFPSQATPAFGEAIR